MASYVARGLSTNEAILYEARLSLWALTPQIAIGLVLLPLFGIGLLVWLAAFVKYKSTELVITNKRVVTKFGFIRVSTVEINLRKIESIQVHQTILGRMCNYGSIVLSGAGNPQAPIPGISNPLMFRRFFVEAQDGTVQAQPAVVVPRLE
jgi:uncharacterized membrane protein YdbT with pleckstrin-like domain